MMKKHVMHSKCDNIELIIYDNTDEVAEEFFESLLDWYEIGWEISMRSSGFIFDCFHLLYYKCHIINENRGGS